MTHDLLNNVIHDLKADIQKIVVSDLKENTFYALIYLMIGGEVDRDRRAAERRDRAGAARARADLRRGPGHRLRPRPSTWRRNAPTPSASRNGSRTSIRTMGKYKM